MEYEAAEIAVAPERKLSHTVSETAVEAAYDAVAPWMPTTDQEQIASRVVYTTD